MKTRRYPGVKPFSEEERHIFYGRSLDTKKLFQLINLEKLVLLYSKSGLGKSSLLNAGVLPLFKEEDGFTTVKIRFGAYVEHTDSPVSKCLYKLPPAPSNSILEKLGAGTDTLWLRMKGLQYKETDATKTYLLVFDQFEELFTYRQEDIKLFKRQLADLLNSKVPEYISKSITNRLRDDPAFLDTKEIEFLYRPPSIKVVLSIRSDRLSHLNTLADYLPNIQKNYYELKSLDRESAIDSIVKPAMDKQDIYLSPSFGYSIDCINKILDYLTQKGHKSIETFQLQTVCQHAENLAMENQLAFDEKKQMLVAEPEMLGDLENIFRTQYDRLIRNIEPAEKQLAARLLIENKLIIDGTRVSLPEVVVLKEKGIDKDLLAYLHDTHHILRSEPNTTDGISYELSHDTLVAPILKAKKEREDKETLARLEAEKQEVIRKQIEKAEIEKIELAKTKKRLRVVYGLLSLALIAILVACSLFVVAKKAERKANVAMEKAVESADEAKRQKDTAKNALDKINRMQSKSIGKRYNGGIIFYSDPETEHGLIAAEKDLEGSYTFTDAVQQCEMLSIEVDGVTYDDWFLPSRDTLALLYFYKKLVGGFTDEGYWSSTSDDNQHAWNRGFQKGYQYSKDKSGKYRVRPVRAF